MTGQLNLFGFEETASAATRPRKMKIKTQPKTTLIEPPFDESLLRGIKGISDIVPILPKYRIKLKSSDCEGRVIKVAVWVGHFHSINDSGWNYSLEEIESYKKIEKNCKNCIHLKGSSDCYLKECYYEERLSCEGCMDHKKRNFKDTKCLKCYRYCFNPDVLRKNISDYYRTEK